MNESKESKESKEKWESRFLIVCTIITVIACLLAIWITCQNAKYAEEIKDLKSQNAKYAAEIKDLKSQNAKYAAEIKDLKSEIGQAYFIEEGTVISASEERQILFVKLDRGDTVSAKVLLTEVRAGCNAHQWHLEGVRIVILRNKAENGYVVLTIFGREQNANTVVY